MRELETINPTTGKTIKTYPQHTDKQINDIVDSSANAFEKWRKLPFSERAKLHFNLADLLEKNADELAQIMTLEMGKPISESKSEVKKCAWVCRYYAENAEKFLQAESINTDYETSKIYYAPIGPVLAIMPWNFPMWQVFRFTAPTLMAGNTALLKHAENVTGCSLAIQSLFIEAGFPDGVFSSLLLSSSRSEHVIGNNKVRALSLTGSTTAGKAVASLAGKYLKKCVLELGGNDAYVILDDANIDKAVELCTKSRMLNAGQSCIAAKRLIVHEKIYDKFTQKVLDKLKDINTVDPTSGEDGIGAMARIDLRDELHKQVQKSIQEGAKCLLGGEITQPDTAYYPPTLLVDVKKGMTAFNEELFGPVVTIIPAASLAQAIELANSSEYGLGGAVFTNNLKLGEELAANEMDTGNCFVNDFVKSDPRLPFGGVKHSGYGRELSHLGIHEFVNAKTVCVKKI